MKICKSDNKVTSEPVTVPRDNGSVLAIQPLRSYLLDLAQSPRKFGLQ